MTNSNWFAITSLRSENYKKDRQSFKDWWQIYLDVYKKKSSIVVKIQMDSYNIKPLLQSFKSSMDHSIIANCKVYHGY